MLTIFEIISVLRLMGHSVYILYEYKYLLFSIEVDGFALNALNLI